MNTAATLTVDRIIFLRIYEDRGIESYGQLQELLPGPGVYRCLIEIFFRAATVTTPACFTSGRKRTAPRRRIDRLVYEFYNQTE